MVDPSDAVGVCFWTRGLYIDNVDIEVSAQLENWFGTRVT